MTLKHGILAAAALLLMAQPALAADESGDGKSILSHVPAEIIDCQPHDEAQEKADAELTATAWELLQKRDLAALRPMLPKLEVAGDHAPDKPSLPEKCGTTLVMYGGGLMELLMASALTEKPELGIDKVVQREALPYPLLHFIIGWLYVDKGDMVTASRWLERGLKNDPRDVLLASEYANALAQSGRAAEALAFVDAFMAANDELSDEVKAVMLRRRGYALGELGRHEEAITAFKASLKLAPGNKVAKSEIEWNKDEIKRKKGK